MRSKLILALLILLAALRPTPAQAQVPDQAYISGVAGHAQIYSLSCESRSAADWAAYWGVYVDETQFLNSLPRSDDPNQGFVGDPDDPWGYIPPNSYGVHAEPVANLLRSYGLDAHAGTGLSWNEVKAEIAAGRPVIVWVIGSIWSGEATKYKTQDGDKVTVAHNEHTMILIGYDEQQVHLVDALTGYTVTHPLENFLASWSVLGNMAVTGEGSGQQTGEEAPSGSQATGDGYIVQPGDTLNKVAQRFDLEWPDLAALNNIAYPYLIYPGQTLYLSPGAEEQTAPTAEPQPDQPAIYTVESGQSLLDVAADLGMDWVDLARYNRIEPPFMLAAGDELEIPESDIPEVQVPDSYTASLNESLVAIAQYYGLDWYPLAAANGLDFPYMLSPGESVTLR